jgi:hypothetical protein
VELPQDEGKEMNARCILLSLIAIIFMACSAAENTPTREIELFHPQKSVVDTTYQVMEE